ncbi:hypothetical protein BHE74_00004829 [Ensete ventricosum]|nr:hypothetical protein BHE74_00004829 [Ensete ventricosum]
MAAEQPGETLIEKINAVPTPLGKIHGGDSSSSSDSDDEKSKASEVAEAVKSKIFRLFGREKPVHRILGGGKRIQDRAVNRNYRNSAGCFVQLLMFSYGRTRKPREFKIITARFVSAVMSLSRMQLSDGLPYVFSMARSPPHIPEVIIPEDLSVNIALSLRYEIDRGFAVLREIATGRDVKKFLAV